MSVAWRPRPSPKVAVFAGCATAAICVLQSTPSGAFELDVSAPTLRFAEVSQPGQTREELPDFRAPTPLARWAGEIQLVPERGQRETDDGDRIAYTREPFSDSRTVRRGPRRGFLIAGYVTLGVPYGLGLVGAAAADFDNHSSWLALPVFGPFLTFARRERACNEIGDSAFDSAYCFSDRTFEWLLLVDGVMQVTGATFIAIGHSMGSVETSEPAWAVTPARIGSGYGLGALGIF